MKKEFNIIELSAGSLGLLLGARTVARLMGKNAADIVSILCDILGHTFPLPIAIAIRSVALAASGAAVTDALHKLINKEEGKSQTTPALLLPEKNQKVWKEKEQSWIKWPAS